MSLVYLCFNWNFHEQTQEMTSNEKLGPCTALCWVRRPASTLGNRFLAGSACPDVCEERHKFPGGKHRHSGRITRPFALTIKN